VERRCRQPGRGRGQGGTIVFALLLGLLTGLPQPARALGDEGADGKFERRESFHFTLYQDVDLDERGGLRGSRRFEQEVLRHLEAAYDRLDERLALRPDRKLVVYVWDPEIFAQRFAGLFRFPAAGFYGGSIHVRGDTLVSTSLVRVLHHELVHAAFDAEAPRLILPAWMNEGIAEWFEARALGKRQLSTPERTYLVAAARRGALFPIRELSGANLGGFEPDAAALAYLQSYGFIDFLAREHGERELVEFWRAVVRSRNVERASKRVYHSDLAELDQAFRRWLGAK